MGYAKSVSLKSKKEAEWERFTKSRKSSQRVERPSSGWWHKPSVRCYLYPGVIMRYHVAQATVSIEDY